MSRHVCSQCGRKLPSAAIECSHCARTFLVIGAKESSVQHVLKIVEPILTWGGGGIFLLSLFIVDHWVQPGLWVMAVGVCLWLIGKLIAMERRFSTWLRSRRLW